MVDLSNLGAAQKTLLWGECVHFFFFHLPNMGTPEDGQDLEVPVRIGKIWVPPYIIFNPSICGLWPYLNQFSFV